MKKRLLSLLLCAAMVFGMMPAVVPTAWAAEGDGTALDITTGVTFTSDTDQLAMEEEFSAVPLSFEATIMLPAGYTDRAGVIAGNYRNGPNGGEFDSTREYVNFEVSTNGNPRLYWQESHGTSTSSSHKLDFVFTEVNVATGAFVHLAITYDPDTDTACCYVDGVLKQTLTSGNITPTVPFGPLNVGGDYRNEASTIEKDCKGKSVPHNEQYFKGTIANLSVWSSVLAETDVKAHYDALCADGTAVPASGDALLGSWDFSAGDSAETFADASANGNDVYVFEDWVDDIDFAEGDYTMLVMPDPQILKKWQTESWYDYTQWIADNVDDLNVQAIISVGDMVNDNTTTQWTQSVKGVETFEATDVPWVPMRGNHDPSAEFNTYFPYSKYGQNSWFGGTYEEGKMDNCYWFVTVGQREYLILYLGWAPTWGALEWAEEVVATFPEKNVIVSTHAYMNWDNTLLESGDGGCVGGYSGLSGYPEGVDIWEALGKYENVVLALGGHIGSTDLATWEDTNGAGKTVTSMLVDSQHLDYVNAGLICVLTFHEDSDTVDVNWYSPLKNAFFRTRNQFSISVPHVAENTTGVDKTALKVEVLNAETLSQINYTAESWAVFTSALSAAKTVLADDSATQEQVDAAEKALENAKAALVERSGLSFSAADKEYAEFTDKAVIPETVEMWVKIPSGYTTRGMIAGGYGYKSATAKTEIFWSLEMNAGGTLRWWEEAANCEMKYAKFDGTHSDNAIYINTGEWMLISIVRDQEKKEVRAYINGELAGTSKYIYTKENSTGSSGTNVFSKTTGKTTTDPTRLGRDWREYANQTALTFEGSIGEIRTWADDRTAEEIKAGYESGIDLNEENLYGCWQLTELPEGTYHPYTFENQATGAAALDLDIVTVGFTSPRDTTGLEEAIEEAKALVEDDYTAETWAALEEALAEAETVLADTTTTQAEVAAAQTALEEAMAALAVEMKGLTFSAAEQNYAEFSQAMTIPETVEVWFQIPDGYGSRALLAGGYGIKGKATSETFWGIDYYSNGTLYWWEETKGYELWTPLGDIEAATGEWILLSIVRDQENDEIRAFVNGELAFTVTNLASKNGKVSNVMDYTTGATTTIPIRLGRDWREDQGKTILTYEGLIGEIRVYSDDRTAEEIKAGYENDILADSKQDDSYLSDANLTGCWRLHDLDAEAGELHTYTYENLSTGTGAVSALTILSKGFTNPVVDSDKTALEAAIDEAEALTEADYTEETWADLEAALEEAQSVLDNTAATQTMVDEATEALEAAMAALVEQTVFVDGLTFSASEKHYAQFTACTEIPETVEVWVKIPEGYSSREMIVGGYGVKGKGYSEIFWSLEMNKSGTLRWWEEGYTQVDGANSPREMNQATFSNIYINTGEWTLITIVRDQENKQVKAYINGELAGTTDKITSKVGGENVFDYTTGKMTTDPPRIGRDWRETLGDAALTFEGQVGEIRMWSDDRTDAEILAGYENDILPDDEQPDTYLSDADLYGAWRLRDLTELERHPFIFKNQATGTGAETALSIKTLGFVTVESDAAADYTAQYNATGVDFDDETHQLRAEEEFTAPVRTISALVNLPSGSAGGVILGNDMYVGGYSSGKTWVNLEVNSSGQPFLQLRYQNQSKPTTVTADTVDLRGKGWVLVTVAFEDETDIVRWYINGKRVESVGSVTFTPRAPYQPMKIGGDYSFVLDSSANVSKYNTTYFKGTIAYVSAWSSVRTDAEILAEAQALQADYTDVPTSGDGLLASWSFAGNGDVLNTIYADKSANGNDATPYAEFINDYDESYLTSQSISTDFAEGDYSILIMPDIQNITRDHMGGYSAYLDDYMQWVADNQEKYNIVAYLNMGDLTQDDSKKNNAGEWENVAGAFPILEEAGIPGVPMRGNHDGSGFYNQFIDYDYYTSQSWFGGVYEDGYLDNSYWFIEAGERTYLVFSLGWSTAGDAIATGNANGRSEREVGDNADLLAWVNETIEKYPNANVIFTAHNGMNFNGNYTANGQKLYDGILAKHDNIVLASYGHVHAPTVVDRVDERGDGTQFTSLLVDGQGIDQYEGCHAFVCLLTFKNDSDEVAVNWYSVREGSLYRVDSQYSITVPHVEGVDLTGLKEDMAAAETLVEDDYTAESWAALEEALAEAETVVENKLSVSQEEVDAAEKALEEALAGLVEDLGPDKTALQEAVDEAETLTEEDYTSDTWAAVEDALETAKEVLADEDATQEEVDAAEEALTETVEALVERGDKTELEELVEEVKAMDEEAYTSDTWAAVEEALAAAEEVLADPDALQKTIDEAKAALEEAVAALVERGDKTELEELVEEVEDMSLVTYTPDTRNDLEDALEAAQAVLDDPDALQEEVDAACAALEEALEALERADIPTSGGTVTEPDDGDDEDDDKDSAEVCPSEHLTDVPAVIWYHEYVDYVVANGLMTGVTATTFDPNGTMTRAMVWTVLARLSGEDVDTSVTPWYAEAQEWAMENEVSDGTMANNAITREQLVTMLYRYIGEPEVSAADKALLDDYTDGEKVSDWAVDAMAWAISNGIINGVTEDTLDPQGVATRAQVAAILQRFCLLEEENA